MPPNASLPPNAAIPPGGVAAAEVACSWKADVGAAGSFPNRAAESASVAGSGHQTPQLPAWRLETAELINVRRAAGAARPPGLQVVALLVGCFEIGITGFRVSKPLARRDLVN